MKQEENYVKQEIGNCVPITKSSLFQQINESCLQFLHFKKPLKI